MHVPAGLFNYVGGALQGEMTQTHAAKWYVCVCCRFPGLPRDMMQVLKACLQPDPNMRATADEILAMPYFDDVGSAKTDARICRKASVSQSRAMSMQASLIAELGVPMPPSSHGPVAEVHTGVPGSRYAI